jgi:hypothetical protein
VVVQQTTYYHAYISAHDQAEAEMIALQMIGDRTPMELVKIDVTEIEIGEI